MPAARLSIPSPLQVLSIVIRCMFEGHLQKGGVAVLMLGIFLAWTRPVFAENLGPDCSFRGKSMYGKVQVVKNFPDLKVQVVASFPDLKVQKVTSFPDSCGKWQYVENFPDFKIQYVNSFPDLKIQFVNSFPGIP